jgi:hypothetical protein
LKVGSEDVFQRLEDGAKFGIFFCGDIFLLILFLMIVFSRKFSFFLLLWETSDSKVLRLVWAFHFIQFLNIMNLFFLVLLRTVPGGFSYSEFLFSLH